MARQHGVPGEWARVRGTALSLWPLSLTLVLLGASLASMILGVHVIPFAVLFVIMLIFTAIYWWKGLKRMESFFRGAHGEENVARMLAALPEGYHVYNDFLSERKHVDHVVVGPAGVFCVETKNWKGAVQADSGYLIVNGVLPSRDPVKQARKESDSVKRTLRRAGWDGGVTPVICFASGSFTGGPLNVGTVTVLNMKDVNAFIISQGVRIVPRDLERLIGLLETR